MHNAHYYYLRKKNAKRKLDSMQSKKKENSESDGAPTTLCIENFRNCQPVATVEVSHDLTTTREEGGTNTRHVSSRQIPHSKHAGRPFQIIANYTDGHTNDKSQRQLLLSRAQGTYVQ